MQQPSSTTRSRLEEKTTKEDPLRCRPSGNSLEHINLSILCRRIDALEDELSQIKSSLSWKITTPLRMLKAIINYLYGLVLPFKRHLCIFNPAQGILCKNGVCYVIGENPYFTVHTRSRKIPCGWLMMYTQCSPKAHRRWALYWDTGSGFNEHEKADLEIEDEYATIIQVPRLIKKMRIDPIGLKDDRFITPVIVFREVPFFVILLYLLWYNRREARLSGKPLSHWAKGFWQAYKKGGYLLFKQRLLGSAFNKGDMEKLYRKWIKRHDSPSRWQMARIREYSRNLKRQVMISVLIPVFNTPPSLLSQAIISVIEQAYQNWEIILIDDHTTSDNTLQVIQYFLDQDPRIKVKRLENNLGISGALNVGLDLAKGEYVALLDHDDLLNPLALFYVALAVEFYPDVKLIYSDEDRVDKYGRRYEPYFKELPKNWDLLLCHNLISHLGVYRTDIAREVRFDSRFDGSQDWDFALRFLEKIEAKDIAHIRHVLYHWRVSHNSFSFIGDSRQRALEAARTAVQEALQRKAIEGKIRTLDNGFFEIITSDGRSISLGKGYRQKRTLPVFRDRKRVTDFEQEFSGLIEAC